MTAITIRSGETCLTRKAGLVVPVDVDPDEPPNKMKWLRVARAISSHNIESFENIMHGQPQSSSHI